ncbi:MAG TPA: FAD binding domain-containing protein [Tepidisphaeraceae bacterium]|nr:FAD binding domain-containing protein [Tepidisphaeraceae bacterium]
MRDYLIIHVNGQRHEIRGERAFQSLSNFLRYDLCLVGTKVVCAEGDCGSCAVLIGRASDDGISYRAVTSCIQFLCQLDGAHVVTVEGLKHDGKLNPLQQALVSCQGTQCGFCTPGFVVSMCAMLDQQPRLDEGALRAGLTGNLCRCTGYESIIRAGMEVPAAELRKISDLYPPAPLLPAMRAADGDPVRASAGAKFFFKPTTVADAVAFKREHPTCAILAGGTDLGVQINKGIRDPDLLLSLSALRDLRDVKLRDGQLVVGAMATLSELERRIEQLVPEFGRMLWRHGSPLIRNAGTLAGNIANGSPIGDTMPALYVLDGEVELTGSAGSRRVNINDFYTGYRKTCAAADEIITRVFVTLPRADETLRLYKVSKRHDLDISTFTGAFLLRRSNGVIGEIRIAYGGCGPNIIRLRRTEAALAGKPLNEAEIEAAAEIARGEITPISDVRGDAGYRLQLAENVLRKFYFDATGEEPTYDRATTPSRAAAPAPAASGASGIHFPGDGHGNGAGNGDGGVH